MQITSIAPWFGGKRTLAPKIVAQLGDHSAYWEPFCGSIAVLLAKPPSGHETVNDLHGDLINLAMVIANPHGYAEKLYERLQKTLYTQTLFDTAKAYFQCGLEGLCSVPGDPAHIAHSHVERAYWYFIVSWMGRNGVSGSARVNYQMAVRWTPGGGGSGQRFRAAVDSIPAWHERLRNVCILRRDAFELLGKIEDVAGVAIYVDPPYFKETRGNGGGARYEHDFKDADHARLAGLLARFKHARVIVSYYDDARLDELYAGWTNLDCSRNKNLHLQNRRGAEKSVAPERLLINGASYTAENTLFASTPCS